MAKKWNSRRKALALTGAGIAAAILLASCTKPGPKTGEAESIDSQHAAESFWDTASIRVTDTGEGRYRDPLDIALSEEEVGAFRLAAERQAGEPGKEEDAAQPLMGEYYSLRLYKENGEKEEELTVDLTHAVTDSRGDLVRSSPYIERWLSEMEAAHEITYSAVLDRAPGKGYFAALGKADHAVLAEMPDKDRTDLARIEFSQPQASVAADALEKILADGSICGSEKETPDARWKLTLYGDGMLLYEFERDADGHVFENGYRINSTKIEEMYSALIGGQQAAP